MLFTSLDPLSPSALESSWFCGCLDLTRCCHSATYVLVQNRSKVWNKTCHQNIRLIPLLPVPPKIINLTFPSTLSFVSDPLSFIVLSSTTRNHRVLGTIGVYFCWELIIYAIPCSFQKKASELDDEWHSHSTSRLMLSPAAAKFPGRRLCGWAAFSISNCSCIVWEITKAREERGYHKSVFFSLPPYPITHCFPVPQCNSQSTAYQ